MCSPTDLGLAYFWFSKSWLSKQESMLGAKRIAKWMAMKWDKTKNQKTHKKPQSLPKPKKQENFKTKKNKVFQNQKKQEKQEKQKKNKVFQNQKTPQKVFQNPHKKPKNPKNPQKPNLPRLFPPPQTAPTC